MDTQDTSGPPPILVPLTETEQAAVEGGSWETRTNRGLRGFLLSRLGGSLQPGIPAVERRPQVVVEDLDADLEQPMRPRPGPPHLLLLHHPLADHLIDRRFHERGRDRLAMAIPVPVVGDRGPVHLDVVTESPH